MQEKRSHNISGKLLEQVISTAYGDAGWIEKLVVLRKAKKDPEILSLLNEYRATANSVHKIKDDDLSESIISSVLDRTIRSRSKGFFGSVIYSGFFARPGLSAGMAGIIILFVFTLFFLQPREERQYTKAEIELAQKQLQESISIVNKVFSKAEHQLGDDVLPNHVDKYLNKGFYFINDLLIGG